MKLPFDFGARFVLRLLFPGTILAVALYPAALSLKGAVYPDLGNGPLLVAVGLTCGFGFLLFDMPIYMALEGRRFWPRRLYEAGLWWQRRRLKDLQDRSKNEKDKARRIELDVRISQYPIDGKTGEPKAELPTRLGNLLSSFETYPTVKYGLDGVFFWHRLWVTIDQDLRHELDGAQAIVDGAVYTCAAFVIAAIICLAYAFLPILQPVDSRWLYGAGGSVVLAWFAYRSAIPPYAQYGELFAAVFDQHRDKLVAKSILNDLDDHIRATQPQPQLPQPQLQQPPQRSDREANMASWRFLRWHVYRPSGGKNQTVQDWVE